MHNRWDLLEVSSRGVRAEGRHAAAFCLWCWCSCRHNAASSQTPKIELLYMATWELGEPHLKTMDLFAPTLYPSNLAGVGEARIIYLSLRVSVLKARGRSQLWAWDSTVFNTRKCATKAPEAIQKKTMVAQTPLVQTGF